MGIPGKDLHWDDYSDPRQARQLRQYVLKEAISKNPYAEFQSAIVMSPPKPESYFALTGIVPNADAEGDIESSRVRNVHVFRVKFIPSDNKRRGASDAIPDFESVATSDDVLVSISKTVNLPLCVSLDGKAQGLKVGDQIKVSTRKSDYDPDVPSLQMCTMETVENVALQSSDASARATIARDFEDIFSGVSTTLELLNIGPGERSNANYTAAKIALTWNDALAISSTSAYRKLGRWVQSAEGTYESVVGQRTGWVDPIINKRIDQMTVEEVYTAMHSTVRQLNQPSNAIGAYQWVDNSKAPTFSEMIAYFTKVSPEMNFREMIFNARNQEAFGVYLFFVKSPILGNYLLGTHSAADEAAQHAAYEWASIPIQYDITSPLDGCNKTVRKGQSAYEGCGGNRSSSRPGHGPADLVALLKETQSALVGLGSIMEIREKNNMQVDDSVKSRPANTAATQASEEEELALLDEERTGTVR